MKPEEINELPAGRPAEALLAERLLGWTRVQAPKYDAKGPLPEQGEVLTSPETRAAIESGEYRWPNVGVVPFEFFLGGPWGKWSEDLSACYREIVPALTRRGYLVRLMSWPKEFRSGVEVTLPEGMRKGCSLYGGSLALQFTAYAPTEALAVTRATLLMVFAESGKELAEK